jgi:hypothetical protein
MGAKVKIGEKEYDTREEEFEIFREDWNEYRLLAGGRLRLKTVVQRITQVLDDDGSPLLNESGDPVVIVRHSPNIVVSR